MSRISVLRRTTVEKFLQLVLGQILKLLLEVWKLVNQIRVSLQELHYLDQITLDFTSWLSLLVISVITLVVLLIVVTLQNHLSKNLKFKYDKLKNTRNL